MRRVHGRVHGVQSIHLIWLQFYALIAIHQEQSDGSATRVVIHGEFQQPAQTLMGQQPYSTV
jgi:hypothetical protein